MVTDEDGNTASDSVIVGATAELALDSVEDASGGVGNIIIAYFNIPLDELELSDVQIRRMSDDQLFPLESVILSSDGLSARIQLNDSQATLGATLEPNTDYNLIVTSEEGTASKVFSIPATADNVTVVGYDKDKREIEVLPIVITATNPTTYGWSATTDKYQFTEDVEVDYANLIGETVTFKYDETNTISNFKKLANEKVIYGAFKVIGTSASDVALQDQLTETKYKVQDDFSGKIPNSIMETYGSAAGLDDDDWEAADLVALINTTYAYGKIVLNTNGTIKSFWNLPAWSGNIYVKEVSGNSIISKTNQEQSLEKYTILSDGKTIDVDDIEEDDIVFYNTTVKMAEVYDDVRVGELQAVYDNAGFKFEDKNRDGSAASYIDGTTQKTVDTDYLKALKAEGEDITVIFNRANEVLYVLGEQGEVATSSYEFVLTSKGDGYAGTTTCVIAVKGSDGEDSISKEIKVSDLTSVTIGGKTYKKTAGTFYSAYDGVQADWGTQTSKETLGFTGTAEDGATAGTASIINLSTDLAVGTLVKLTENDDGKVVGIEVMGGTALIPYNAGNNDTIFGGQNKSQDFKAGYKTVQINQTTPTAVLTIPTSADVYVVGKKDSKVVIDKTSYADFDKTVANAYIANVKVYSSGTSVTDFVIENQKSQSFATDTEDSTTVEGVVKEVHYLGGVISDLTIVTADGDVTFDTFASDTTNLKTTVAQGDIVDVTVLADGETLYAVAADTETAGDYTGAVYGVKTTAPGEFYIQGSLADKGTLAKRTLTSDALIVKVADDTVSKISLSDLKSLALTKEVKISTVVAGNDKVDTVVVTSTARDSGDTHEADGATNDTASTDFVTAVDALVHAIGETGAYKALVQVATDVTDASTAVSSITDKDEYAAAKSAMSDLKVLYDDIVAADGTTTDLQDDVWDTGMAAKTLYDTLSKKADAAGADDTSVAWAGKNVIVVNAIDIGSAVATAATTNANATALIAALPGSVTAESLDGTTYTISDIVKPTSAGAATDTLTAAATTGTGWYWDNTDTFKGGTVASYTFTLTGQASNTAEYANTITNITVEFAITT